MIKNSFKRLIRDKSMWLGYLCVCILFFATSFYPMGLLESASIRIKTIEKKSAEHQIEDGFFETYVPLTKENIKRLEENSTYIEEHFNTDVRQDDDSVLRVTTPRKKIDIQYITSGKLPQKGQIMLERIYAEVRNLSIGEKFNLGDKTYEISGFMALPDYEAVLKNISDTSADGKSFGLAFLTKGDYEEIKKSKKVLQAETLNYAFLLGKDVSHEEFKEKLLDMKIPINEINDEEFRNYVNEKRKEIDEVLEKLSRLKDGTKQYENAVIEYSNVTKDFKSEFEKISLPIPIKLKIANYFDGAEILQNENFKFIEKLRDFSEKTEEKIEKEFPKETPNLSFYLSQKENPRIFAGVDDAKVDRSSTWPASMLTVILCSYAITVLIGHIIEKEKPVIGTLTALGIKRWKIILSYSIGPTLVVAIGTILGIIGAYNYNIADNMAEAMSYYSMPNMEISWSKEMIFLGLIYPVFITFLICIFFIHRKLKQSALSLIRNQKNAKISKRKFFMKGLKFESKFRFKFLYGEKKSLIITFFAIFLSLWILCLGVHISIYCKEIKKAPYDLKYDHMYCFKYPSKELPNGGEKVYLKSLSGDKDNYTFQVNLLGIEEDSIYFPKINLRGNKDLAISKAVALKYKLNIGDDFLLSDKVEDLDYVFKVKQIVDYPQGLHVFVPVEKAAKLFGKENERNTIFSNEKLNINPDKLSFHLEKKDMIKQGEVFYNIMQDMIETMRIIGVLFMFFILLQMMKIMTDRAKKNISLFKVLGYSERKVWSLYLLPQWLITVIGIAIAIPLGKICMDLMYPSMIANVPWEMKVIYPLPIYIKFFLSLTITSFIIMTIFAFRIRKIDTNEILKNRE